MAKTELEEAGLETEGMVESTATLRAEIEALSGVDIMEADGQTFKSTYAILDELAQKWGDLSDIQQATITELIAGKRQGNVISSLMQNFDVARNALETSLNSSGSAMAEHAKWSQSLEARLNKLKSAWQGLSQAFMKSSFLKGALDAVIGLVDGLTKLIDTIGVIPTLATAFAAFKTFTKGGSFFKVITDEATGAATGITRTFWKAASESRKALQSIGFKGDSSFKDALKADITAFGDYRKAIRDGMSETEAQSKYLKNASTAFQDYQKSGKLATEGVGGFIKQQQLAQVSVQAQNKSLSNARMIMKEYYSGCKATGVGQNDFANAVRKTNPQLATAMTTSKNSAGAMVRYTTSLIGAKAATIGLQIATTALNAVIGMGIGALVSVVITKISDWINAEEKLAEKVEEVTSKYKEQHDELQKLKGDYNTDSESSMISRYEKLSRGVDNLGRNVSLTTDEYSEYQSIVNKIADQIPSLVSGYDSQGNAILSCKGNVEELTEAYEKLIHAQNTEILSNTKDIEKNFKKASDPKNGFITSGWNRELENDSIKILEDVLKNGLTAEEIKEKYNNRYNALEIQNALESIGINPNEGRFWSRSDMFGGNDPIWEALAETYKTDPSKIKGVIDDYYAQFDEIVQQQKTIAQAKLSEAFDVSSKISGLNYGNISEDLQAVAYQVVGSLDKDFFDKLQTDGKTVEQWTTEMLNQLNSIGKDNNTEIEAAFDLQTQFNGGEISYGEYVNGLGDVESLIEGLDLKDEVKSQLKISLGLDEEGVIDQYNALVKKLSEDSDAYDFKITEQQAKNLLDGLSSEELAIAVDVITEMQENGVEETIDEVRNAIDRQLAIQGLTLELDIEVEKTKLEALTTALTESFSGSGLSSESITAVEDMFSNLSSYDPSKLFERTANGIKLNNAELRKLNDESKKTNIAKLNKEMDSLGDIYNQTREELYTLTYGTEAYNEKAAELKGIEDRIKATEKLAAQYEGLASAYQEWQMAESSGSERGMYEGLLEGWENVGDELSRGWVDDGTREFIELLKGETATIIDGNGVKKEINIATASAKELKQVWKDLDKNIQHTTYSVHDFFTVDDEGNSTSKGVFNFLDAIGQMEEEKFNGKDVVRRDKDGNIIGFDFEIVGGDKAIAEALGISEELVQIMKRASADAGFVVSFDGTYQQLDILREKAQTASETLNKILKEKGHGDKVFSYDFNSNDEKDIINQLENANKALNTFKKSGKVDLSVEGAQEALTVASTLQSMLDKLQRPAYMQIEVSEVEKNLQDPLRNLQELRTLTETEHQLKLSGADTSKLKESKQEIYDYFENLDPEIKTELGLVDDKGNPLTGQALQDKLNSGEIAIEATVDIQMSMDDKLGILVDKALYDAGIIDKKEFTKRVNVYLEADEVDDSDVDDKVEETFEEGNGKKSVVQKEVEIEIVENTNDKIELDNLINNVNPDPIKKKVIVEYFAEHSDVDNYTPNQKKALVEFIANTDNLDEYTPEEKQAIVEYLTDSADPDSWTPEQKEAVAKFIRESSDVDSYTPDQKKAIAKFIKDSIEPDSYTPPSPTSTVTFNKDTSDIDTYDPPNFTRYVTYYAKKAFNTGAKAGEKALENRFGIVNGTANSDGAAFANGTAFKQGNWRTKKTERALVGELGQELVVTGNHWYTVGDMGAEFTTIPKGSIVFNHKQTEELFKNGKVTSNGGRGRFFANGTTFAQGTAYNGYDGKESHNVGENDKFEETFDWIDILFSRLERTIDNLDKTVNNAYKSWSDRNNALASEIVEVGKLINQQNSAYTTYMNKADAVGLSESWASKVRNGSLSIEDETTINESTAEKIKEYQEWYEKALKCEDAIEDLKQTEAELYEQRFENVQSEYDSILQGFEHTESMLNEYISQAEAKGRIVSKSYYQALIINERKNINALKNEQADLIAKRDEAVASGAIVKGSQAWYDMCAEIDNVTQSIEEAKTSTIEWGNAIRDIGWDIFDLIQERISDVTAEADFLINLMSNEKLFDDNGNMTDKGFATMGLHGQNYNTYMYQADEYKKEIAELDEQIAKDSYNQELINRRQELIELQRESILAAEDEKQAIKDLVEEGINLELEALQERIDLHNEELESMKDIYDYQKNVQKQSEEIAALEKQRAAYLNDDSEENKARLQEITVSLKEAKENLQETEYDRYISDQSALLDSLYEEYELILNQRLDNVDALLSDMITEINANATTISSTLSTEAANVGTTISEVMKGIWENDGVAKSVIAEYGSGFQNKQTTTNLTLDSIKQDVNAMVDDVDKDAQAKTTTNKTSASATTNPVGGSNTPPSSSSGNNKSAGDGKAKIGDKVTFLSGKYYYDSQGVNPAGSKNHGKQVYITNINKKSWATHPYHISTGKKLGQGDLGWLKLNQLSGYATGKKNFLNSEIAWTQENGQEFIIRPSDGAILTPIAKGDSVLTSAASNNIWDMANSPAEFIKDNLNLGVANVPNNSNVNNSCIQNFENIVFSMPNVKNYDELVLALQKDPKFDKLIKAMTIDQIAGRSSLAKGKSIR